MKKIVLIALAVVMALGAISAFAMAGAPEGIVTFDGEYAAPVGGSMNDPDVSPDTQNRIRQDWTNSRGLPDAISNAIFTDDNGNTVVKLTASEFMVSDFNMDAYDGVVSVDLKAVKLGTFCGLVCDLDEDEKSEFGSGTPEFAATANGLPFEIGFGFTLLEGNKIRVFVSGLTYAYADFDLGFDAAADYHTYAIYREGAGKASSAVDNKIIAIYDCQTSNVKLCKADGTALDLYVANVWNTGYVGFAVIGDDVEIYMDNIGFMEIPETGVPTETVVADPVASYADPAPTAKPEPTAAPATDAPTAAPEATEEPKTEGGCGSLIGGGLVLVAAVAVVALRKKED